MAVKTSQKVLITILTLLACSWTSVASADRGVLDDVGNPNPGLFQPREQPYGKNMSEWSAAWWQWALSLPVASHPLLDTAPCSEGQSGPVWFLGGAFTGAATVRDCTIPTGTSLFLPVLNAECSDIESPPFFGADEAAMRACAQDFMSLATNMTATIDGQPVADLERYHVSSPFYSFNSPADGLFGPDPVSGNSVSDGVWLFLKPLSAGNHTIHFTGSVPDYGFDLDVTYNLNVQPGLRGKGTMPVVGEPSSESTGDKAVQRTTWGRLKVLYR
jgi:hypothetical protein